MKQRNWRAHPKRWWKRAWKRIFVWWTSYLNKDEWVVLWLLLNLWSCWMLAEKSKSIGVLYLSTPRHFTSRSILCSPAKRPCLISKEVGQVGDQCIVWLINLSFHPRFKVWLSSLLSQSWGRIKTEIVREWNLVSLMIFRSAACRVWWIQGNQPHRRSVSRPASTAQCKHMLSTITDGEHPKDLGDRWYIYLTIFQAKFSASAISIEPKRTHDGQVSDHNHISEK